MDRDPASFVFLQGPYSKDKNGIYFEDEKILVMADPNSFRMLDEKTSIGIDTDGAYLLDKHGSYKLEGADPLSLRVAPGDNPVYLIDSNNAFYVPYEQKDFKKLEEAILPSFRAIDYDETLKSNATDGTHYWLWGKRVDKN